MANEKDLENKENEETSEKEETKVLDENLDETEVLDENSDKTEILEEVVEVEEIKEDILDEEGNVVGTIDEVIETVEEVPVSSDDSDKETRDDNEYQAQHSNSLINDVEKDKKKVLQKPIIIAACILAVALIAFLVYTLFFHNTIQGTWEIEGSDGYTYYYNFENTASATPDLTGTQQNTNSKKVTMTFGTISFVGDYITSNENGVNSVTINQYYGELYGNYTVEIKGNKIFGGRTLTLTNENGDTFELKQASAPSPSTLLKKPENFEVDENLIGEWEYVFEDYGVSYKFKFNKDGTMQINQYDSIIYDCVYTADGSVVKCTFYANEETSQDLEYSCDGTTLEFMGLRCTRVGAATKDQVETLAQTEAETEAVSETTAEDVVADDVNVVEEDANVVE